MNKKNHFRESALTGIFLLTACKAKPKNVGIEESRQETKSDTYQFWGKLPYSFGVQIHNPIVVRSCKE